MVRWLAVAILLAGLVGFPGVPARAEAPTAPAPRRPAPEEAPPEAPTPLPGIPIPPTGGAATLVGASPGWYLIPSFFLTEEFDDNIFATSEQKQWDFISRFSPGLAGGYRSEPFTLLLSGGFDAEVFARHPELNDAVSGWHVGLDALYLPIRPLAFGLTFPYIETNTTATLPLPVGIAPTVIAPATVLEFGRRKATFLTAAPSAAYQFTPLTFATATYTYTHDTIQDGESTTVNSPVLRLSHQFTSLDTGTLGYRVAVYDIEGSPTRTSHAPTVGWTRALTPQTKLFLEGGPRFSDGDVGPEVSARLEQDFRWAKLALAYARSEGFILGQPGIVTTETYLGSIVMEPVKSLLVSVGPTITKLSGKQTLDTNFYELVASASYPILRWLTARATYRFGYVEQLGAGDILRNVFSVSLEATYPYRVGQ